MQQQQTISRRGQAAYGLLSATMLLLCLAPATPSSAQDKAIDAMCMVEEHNTLRATVGVPELHWSKPLARQAAAWAAELKKSGVPGIHFYILNRSYSTRKIIEALT